MPSISVNNLFFFHLIKQLKTEAVSGLKVHVLAARAHVKG